MKFYKHPADFCFKLPPNVTMEEAAVLEPLSVGVHACRRAGVGLGSEVLILGAGPIGLVTLMTAKAMGAGKVLITDMVEGKLEIAKSLGATYTMLVKKDMTEESLVKQVHEIMGSAPDKAIDCCGGESTSRLAILVISNKCDCLIWRFHFCNYAYRQPDQVEVLLSWAWLKLNQSYQ